MKKLSLVVFCMFLMSCGDSNSPSSNIKPNGTQGSPSCSSSFSSDCDPVDDQLLNGLSECSDELKSDLKSLRIQRNQAMYTPSGATPNERWALKEALRKLRIMTKEFSTKYKGIVCKNSDLKNPLVKVNFEISAARNVASQIDHLLLNSKSCSPDTSLKLMEMKLEKLKISRMIQNYKKIEEKEDTLRLEIINSIRELQLKVKLTKQLNTFDLHCLVADPNNNIVKNPGLDLEDELEGLNYFCNFWLQNL